MLKLGAVWLAALACLAAPAGAAAQRLVPPGNSAVNQYTETVPTSGGDVVVGETKPDSPAKTLGADSARRLDALGPDGRAAAALAAATALQSVVNGSGHDSTGNIGTGEGGSQAQGSSGLGDLIRAMTGTSSTSQTGLLAPLAILAAMAGSLIYLWRRKRPAA